MKIKTIIDEDFVNYKKPSMFIATAECDWKCCKECGKDICQNMQLAQMSNIEISPEAIIARFKANPISEAIVFGGLEPLYAQDNHVHAFHIFSHYIYQLPHFTDIVVYTGYYPSEIHYSNFQFWQAQTNAIHGDLIFKFGRYVPNKPSRRDPILGVELASDNQFAINISAINAEYAEEAWQKMVEIEKQYHDISRSENSIKKLFSKI